MIDLRPYLLAPHSMIQSFKLYQFIVGTYFYNFTFFKHIYSIGMHNGAYPMCN